MISSDSDTMSASAFAASKDPIIFSGYNDLFDNSVLEKTSYSVPLSNQVSIETLTEEIFSNVVFLRIHCSSQFELLNSFRVEFFRQRYEASLKSFLSANYVPLLPITYAQLDSLIVQAVAFLGFH